MMERFTPFTLRIPKMERKLTVENYQTYKADFTNFFKINFSEIHSLQEIGFQKTEFEFIEPTFNPDIIDEYDKFRDYPAMQRTTQLGIALASGTISVRQCVAFALEHNQTLAE